MRTKDTTQTIYNLVRTAPKEIKKAPKTTPTKSSGQGSLFKDPVARSNMLELKKAELIADGRRYGPVKFLLYSHSETTVETMLVLGLTTIPQAVLKHTDPDYIKHVMISERK